MHSLAIVLLVSGLGVEFAQAPAESENPMHRFKPFIGTWNYQGTEQLSPSEPIAKVEFECKISFLPGEKVLLVDNTSLDGSYRFFGFHYRARRFSSSITRASMEAIGFLVSTRLIQRQESISTGLLVARES